MAKGNPRNKYTRCFRCNKRTELHKCKHCGNYFCKDHSKPKLPLTVGLVQNEKDPVLSSLYEKEWKHGGHACVNYGTWKLNEIKKEEDKISKDIIRALDNIKKSDVKRPEQKSYVPPKIPKVEIFRKSWFRRNLKNMIIIGILLLILYLILSNLDIISSYLEPMINNIQLQSTGLLGKPEINTTELEMEIHNLVNNERVERGLAILGYDQVLSDIARTHSIDMGLNGYFDHVNLKGQDPSARANAAGYSCYKNYGSYYTEGIAENIHQDNLYSSVTTYNGIPSYDWNNQSEIAVSTVDSWMNSPGHRKNILTASYDKEGIGVFIAADDKVYITQNFC